MKKEIVEAIEYLMSELEYEIDKDNKIVIKTGLNVGYLVAPMLTKK